MKAPLALLALLALAPSATGSHCAAPFLDRESALVVSDPESGEPLHYLHAEDCQAEGCAFAVRAYEESNGLRNLQLPEDTCHGMVPFDALVF